MVSDENMLEGYEVTNSVDIVKEEFCGNTPHDDPQTSMFVDLAEKSNGEIVFAVDEHGNKIAQRRFCK